MNHATALSATTSPGNLPRLHLESEKSDPNYRQVRASMLETYCYAVLQGNRQIKRVVGIAMDKPDGSRGRSEDLLAVEVTEWTSELDEDVTRRRSVHEVLVQGRMLHRSAQSWEYPPATLGNRQERRAAERLARQAARRASARRG